MYNDDYSYSYINVARSAIASTFAFEGNSLEEHPIVRRFMLGVRNLRKACTKVSSFLGCEEFAVASAGLEGR